MDDFVGDYLNLINLHDLFESIPFERVLFWCFGLWICMIFEIWDWAIWIVADWVSSLSFSTKRLREIENTRIEFDAQYSIEIHFSWWKKNRKNVMAKIRAKFIRKELMTPQKKLIMSLNSFQIEFLCNEQTLMNCRIYNTFERWNPDQKWN